MVVVDLGAAPGSWSRSLPAADPARVRWPASSWRCPARSERPQARVRSTSRGGCRPRPRQAKGKAAPESAQAHGVDSGSGGRPSHQLCNICIIRRKPYIGTGLTAPWPTHLGLGRSQALAPRCEPTVRGAYPSQCRRCAQCMHGAAASGRSFAAEGPRLPAVVWSDHDCSPKRESELGKKNLCVDRYLIYL